MTDRYLTRLSRAVTEYLSALDEPMSDEASARITTAEIRLRTMMAALDSTPAEPANPQLAAVVDQALHDLECAELRCWCFTRAAMRGQPPCTCANCTAWKSLSAALDSERK